MLRKLIGRAYLTAAGWRPEGKRPEPDKYVLIAAPHTSNWDLAYTLSLSYVLDVDIRWVGKKSLFRFPQGMAMTWLGGIPVDRAKRQNKVEQIAELIRSRDRIVVVVPPEGTRGGGQGWRSGFYHIARAAGVPIVLGYLDYGRKRGGFGPVIDPTGDIVADMDRIRAFYHPSMARYPEKFRVPRLADEEDELKKRRSG